MRLGTVPEFLAAVLVVALAGASVRSESSSPRDALALTPGPADRSLEVRATYWVGTSRPHRLLIAWNEGSRSLGREVVWYRVGARPADGSWREIREWARSSRPKRRLLARNCGHRPQVDGEMAWCVAADDVTEATWPAELVALAPLLWEMPDRPYSGCLDGSGFKAQVRDGDRVREVTQNCLGYCTSSPSDAASRVLELERRRWRPPPGGWRPHRASFGR